MRPSGRVTRSAFWIGGMSPSNWTSTTAPMTWVTRPMALLGVGLVAMSLCSSHPLEARHARLAAGGPAAGAFRAEAVLQGFCARDDFDQLDRKSTRLNSSH